MNARDAMIARLDDTGHRKAADMSRTGPGRIRLMIAGLLNISQSNKQGKCAGVSRDQWDCKTIAFRAGEI